MSLTEEGISTADFLPSNGKLTIRKLQQAARGCRGCQLFKKGTQTVFGEGPATARIVFVGEQPGDQEDLQGHPFVGPAGRILDRGLCTRASPASWPTSPTP